MNAITTITAQPKGDRMRNRGRPAGRMTKRREQVLAAYREMAASGELPSMARIARKIGVHDYRDVRRILGDLRRMAAI